MLRCVILTWYYSTHWIDGSETFVDSLLRHCSVKLWYNCSWLFYYFSTLTMKWRQKDGKADPNRLKQTHQTYQASRMFSTASDIWNTQEHIVEINVHFDRNNLRANLTLLPCKIGATITKLQAAHCIGHTEIVHAASRTKHIYCSSDCQCQGFGEAVCF